MLIRGPGRGCRERFRGGVVVSLSSHRFAPEITRNGDFQTENSMVSEESRFECPSGVHGLVTQAGVAEETRIHGVQALLKGATGTTQ